MIGVIGCVLAAVSTFVVSKRSLGHGLGVCLFWGYVYGVFRANYLDGFAHFLFDATVFGLYAARLNARLLPPAGSPLRPLMTWVAVLCAWPTVLVLLPYDHLLINLVGLRVAIYYVPVLLVGAQMTDVDLDHVGTWLAGLSLLALAAAVLEVVRGIEVLYPHNSVTWLIYATAIGESSSHRIPAIFCTAHHYGGCMELSLPFLMAALLRSRSAVRTVLLLVGMGATGAGLLLCSCRSPVLGSGLAFAVYLLFQGKVLLRPRFVLMAAAFAGAVAYTLLHGGSRTERFMELGDVGTITERAGGFQEEGLLPSMVAYPLGNGLAGAGGVTIPYFLQELSTHRDIPGVESEYFRILFTQGIPGLLLWLGFLLWFFTLPVRGAGTARPPAYYYLFGAALVSFVMASRGVGLLYGLPVNCLLLLGMGAVVRRSYPAPRPAPAAPAPRVPRGRPLAQTQPR